MRKKTSIISTVCLFTFILMGCGNAPKETTNPPTVKKESAETSDDSAIDDQLEEEQAAEAQAAEIQINPEFEAFWKNVCASNNNEELLTQYVDFPIFIGDYENEVVEIDRFPNVFEAACYQIPSEMVLFDGKGMHVFLVENFNKKYGNLDDIYVVHIEPAPEGYSLYFKLFEGGFKLIGLEVLFIAD